MQRLADMVEDLRVGSPAQASESLMALISRGSHAVTHLRHIADDLNLRAKAVAALSDLGGRGVLAYASASPASKRVLHDLLLTADPAVILRAVWQIARSEGQLVTATAWPAVVQLVESIIAAQPAGASTLVLGQVGLGLARRRAGEDAGAESALRNALAFGTGQPGDREALTDAALVLGAAAISHARPDDLLAPLSALAEAGATGALANLLAASLLQLPVSGDLRVLLALVISELGGGVDPAPSIAHVLEAWQQAGQGLQARALVRQGYFAAQLEHLDQATRQVSSMLEQEWIIDTGTGGALEVCNVIVQQLNELLSDLVAYQPLSFAQVSPRQLILEVAMASKEELASFGVAVKCSAPPAQPADEPVTLDPAMVKGLLRQVLRHLVRHAAVSSDADGRADAKAIKPGLCLVAESGPHGMDEPATVFAVSLAGFGQESTQLLREALATATVPDILSRTGAVTRVSGPVHLPSLEILFPAASSMLDDAGQGLDLPMEQPVPELPEVLAAAVAGGATPDELAAITVASFEALRRSELGSWGEDLSIVLHDLKNSVAFVSGWLRESDVYDQITVRSRCLDNLSDVQFWLSQVGAMLSRPVERERPWLDLGELTGRVLRGLAALLAHRRQRLKFDVASGLPKIQAEPVWVASILRNLAKNAIEAMGSGGTLRVMVNHAQSGMVEVTLRDEGPGFPETALTDAESSPSPIWSDGLRRPQVGLASVRRILAEQRGQLELRNDGGGVATVRFSTGSGVPELAEQVAGWEALDSETRRALVAARALAHTDRPTANHLWTKAIQLTAFGRLGEIAWPALIPWGAGLTEKASARPALSQSARRMIATAAVGPGLARTEAAARRLVGKVLDGRARVVDLSPLEVGLLLLLWGSPELIPGSSAPLARLGSPATLNQLARDLLAVAMAIDDETREPAVVEQAVIKPLVGLISLGELRSA